MPTPEELKLADAPLNDLALADAPIDPNSKIKKAARGLAQGVSDIYTGLEKSGGKALGTEGYAGFGPINVTAGLVGGVGQYLGDIPKSIYENFKAAVQTMRGKEVQYPPKSIAQTLIPSEAAGTFLQNPSYQGLPAAVLEQLGNILAVKGLGPKVPASAGLLAEARSLIPEPLTPKPYDAAVVETRIKANVEAMRNSRLSTQAKIKNLADEQGLEYKGMAGQDIPMNKKTAGIRPSEHVIQDPITGSSFGVQKPSEFLDNLAEHRQINGFDLAGNKLPEPSTLEKFVKAIDEAAPLRKEQKQLYHEELSKRSARVAAAGREVYGEKGLFAQLGELKGPLPKKMFEAIRGKFSPEEIDGLFASIEDTPTLLPFEKVNGKVGLMKLLDGAIPTEGELNLLRETFPKEVIQAILSKQPVLKRIRGYMVEGLGLPRAILASTDLSAPFRQGVFMMGRPVKFARAFGSMFKYFGSENAYQGLMESIRTRPNYLDMKRGGLQITELGGQLTKREERFMSQLAEKIPVLGHVARASNRAYTGFLDKLRADVFDDVLAKADKMGIERTNDLLQSLGDFVNAGTGRGKFGLAETGVIPKSMEGAATVMNGIFFSPRLMASRLNLMNPYFYVQMNPFVRKEALKTLFGTTGIWASLYGLWKLNGGNVGVDPRSADFGKLKVGDTRYDPLGGFQQYIRLASQLISGEVVSSTTGRTLTLGEGYKPLTRKDIAIRFFENKESPIASFVTGLLTQTNATGQKFDVPTEVIARFIPMMIQDLYDLSQEKGAESLLGGIPGVFGVGVQTYGKQELKKGKNVIGEPTAGISPIDNLAEKIRALVVGQLPIRQSAQYSVDAFYDQLEKLPPEQKQQIFGEIAKNNVELAQRLIDVKKRRILGITIKDEDLKSKGISSGERALTIKKQLDKLPDPQDKSKLVNEYIAKGIITSEVLRQINHLHAQELSK